MNSEETQLLESLIAEWMATANVFHTTEYREGLVDCSTQLRAVIDKINGSDTIERQVYNVYRIGIYLPVWSDVLAVSPDAAVDYYLGVFGISDTLSRSQFYAIDKSIDTE